MRRLGFVVLCSLLLTGCVTVQRRGEHALYAGDYNEAIQLFQATLAEHPDRLDARLGLGLALYKAGAVGDAALTLDEVLARAPTNASALLYRGLVAIQQRDDPAAVDYLTHFGQVAHIPRFEPQLALALRMLRGSEPLGSDTRQFMVASLEDAVRRAREVEQARLAAQRAYLTASPPVRCAPTRAGWICL